MKLIPLFALLVAVQAGAQDVATPPADQGQTFETEAARRLRQSPPVIRELKPNEIVAGKLTYDGIVVEAIKKKNLFQLINPFAPTEFGKAEDNLVRDPITRQPTGLKFFSVRF